MDCTKCGGKICRGEQRVTITRNVEVEQRGNLIERAFGCVNVIVVKDSEPLATYHERCEPQASPSRSTAMAAR